ncbi:DUF1992 domain-containing protein [Glycomyces buryatensis]|uniref:DUF1992 domain-containing protein n=1 Tax=Glycomyces buryatensis TaxID=2570927 RepID=A0A4S8PQM9_9ACTN|nr:DUF1992 domain-containing protein [Glycomyces buryatensis]THV33460.1 DUF1992 domain-containing protein [Glycomyces buryatensis]
MSDRQARGVDRQIQDAEARGEFRNLPGAGKPLNLGDTSPDWWLRQKTTRENIGAEALPPALRLGKELEDLPDRLDALAAEADVREAIDEFNVRIRKALIAPTDGPPLRFGLVDAEATVAAWRERRTPAGE